MQKASKEGPKQQEASGAAGRPREASANHLAPGPNPSLASAAESRITTSPNADKLPADHTGRMRQMAHERLDWLFGEAIASRFYGRIALEITFENGRPLVIHRHIEGVDK